MALPEQAQQGEQRAEHEQAEQRSGGRNFDSVFYRQRRNRIACDLLPDDEEGDRLGDT